MYFNAWLFRFVAIAFNYFNTSRIYISQKNIVRKSINEKNHTVNSFNFKLKVRTGYDPSMGYHGDLAMLKDGHFSGTGNSGFLLNVILCLYC